MIASETDGLRKAVATLQDMIKSFGKFEGFSILGMKDMSLLLATIVSRTLVCYQDRSLLSFSRDAVELFRIVLALNGLEEPMCLALWLESIYIPDGLDRSLLVRNLFAGLRSYYLISSISHPAITPETVVAGMVLKLLCLDRTEFPFFLRSLHYFMEEALGCPKWEAIWKMLKEQKVYVRHQERIVRDKQSLSAIWQLQENGVL